MCSFIKRILYLNVPELYFRIRFNRNSRVYENVQFTLILSGKFIVYISKLVFNSANQHITYTKITLKIIFQKKNDKFENMSNKVDCKFEVER